MTLRDTKQALREAIAGARDALPAAWRAQASQAIAARIADLDSFARARVVLLTLPCRSEWDARLLAHRALAAGKVVVAPRVDTSTRMLRPFQIDDLERDVESGYRGIPEPRVTCREIALERVEWVLVPGLAFDASRRRLGYGGGYYDRLLPSVPPAASRVAGAFDVQIVDAVPTAPHDVAVDCIVTERRVLRAAE
ncbi:MAG TPA: 5-formyltetrahydrofolate cyclo-ligase [Casimicrobiaceae bacterium]|jgi:5-formyltetrahydrofolate cyclo-ligase